MPIANLALALLPQFAAGVCAVTVAAAVLTDRWARDEPRGVRLRYCALMTPETTGTTVRCPTVAGSRCAASGSLQ
jgi:hypothetical protein